jgi:excisionase family DNA binding protein
MTIHVRIVNSYPLQVQPEYLSPAGVAKYLGVNRRTVYTWIKGNYLPAVKTGPKLWAVALTDLQNFLQPGAARRAAAAPAVKPSSLPQPFILPASDDGPGPRRVVYGGSLGPSEPPGLAPIPPARLSVPKTAKKGRRN